MRLGKYMYMNFLQVYTWGHVSTFWCSISIDENAMVYFDSDQYEIWLMLKSMASKNLVKDPFRSHLPRNHRANQNYSINISIAFTNQSIFQRFILRIFRTHDLSKLPVHSYSSLAFMWIFILLIWEMSRCNFF